MLPPWYWYLLSAVWGAAWGSFANVLIHRLPEGMNIASPPSHCPVCGERIRWWQNIPILSYVFLRGHCGACGARISPRYPAVEALSVVLALLAMHHALAIRECPAPLLAMADFHFLHLLMVLAFIDFETFILPDVLVLPGVVAALAARTVFNMVCYDASVGSAAAEPLSGAAAGFGVLASIALLYRALRGREGMGLGDAKLLGLIGAWLGPLPLILVILLASLQGIVFTLLLHALRIPLPYPRPYSGLTTQEELDEFFGSEDSLRFRPVPFGPFLALAAAETLLWGEWIMHQVVHNGLYG